MATTREMIRTAFEGASRPVGAREIAPHQCFECDELSRDLACYSVESLPTEVIDRHFDCLPLLGPDALCYYLPAWLLRALDDPAGDVMEHTIFHLTPSARSFAETPGYFEERFSRFNRTQRAAIAAFFEEVTEKRLWVGFEGELERAEALWALGA